MVQTRMLHGVESAPARPLVGAHHDLVQHRHRGGALAGGILLDQVGIRTLPWVDVALVALGFVVLVVGSIAITPKASRGRGPALT